SENSPVSDVNVEKPAGRRGLLVESSPEDPRLLPRGRLRSKTLLLGSQLRREFRSEVLHLEERPNLDLRLLSGKGIRAALDPIDRLVDRLHLPQPVSGDELLGLGARPLQ